MDFQEFIQDKANKLVALGWPDDMILAFIDGAERTNNYFGWHPASELPPLDKDGNSQDVIVICGTMNLHYDLPRWSSVVNGIWGDKDVKWWIVPPQKD